MTANDVPAIRGTSRILVDVFMRKYRVKFDVKECRGQLAVECGDDPPGGLSTLSAHQMAHGGLIPHSSSSVLSAHQMFVWLTSARIAKTTPPIWERTSAKPHDVAAAPPPNLSRKGVERGRMMCLPQLSWITAFNDTVESTNTEENATETGKHVRERLSARPHGVAGAPHRICPGKESARKHDVSAAPPSVLYRLFTKDVMGPTHAPTPVMHGKKDAHATSRTSPQFID